MELVCWSRNIDLSSHSLAWLNSVYFWEFFRRCWWAVPVWTVECSSPWLLQFRSLHRLWAVIWNKYLVINSVVLSNVELQISKSTVNLSFITSFFAKFVQIVAAWEHVNRDDFLSLISADRDGMMCWYCCYLRLWVVVAS